mmetsp:Transcript_31207/g.75058  ORF Transcript_31207/g.75058 Transcript_31207/m.75058 type:complete len:385 (-) Transcript_31207:167-1321(-)
MIENPSEFCGRVIRIETRFTSNVCTPQILYRVSSPEQTNQSYSMVTWAVIAGETFILKFSDGRRFDIGTKEGANALLRGLTKFDLFSSKMKAISKIQKKKRLNNNDKGVIRDATFVLRELSRHCDEVLFREKIPLSEIQCWLDFTILQLHKMSSDPKWIHKGHLELYDKCLLSDPLTMFLHPVPVDLAFEGKYFQALADFAKAYKSRRSSGDSEKAFEVIFFIVIMAFRSSTESPETNSSAELVFQNFEASGVLEQVFRCIAISRSFEPYAVDVMSPFLDELGTCSGEFLGKKFNKGQPCGDMLYAILDQGLTNFPEISIRLENIKDRVEQMGVCNNCGKSEEELQKLFLMCSGCRSNVYCSEVCQLADWKAHKKECRRATSNN